MYIDPLELGRLFRLLKYPQTYIERRVEAIDLKDDHHYAVTVTQQLVIPEHAPAANPQPLLLPVGYFSKTLLPDLRVTDENGVELAVPTRADRATINAVLVSVAWQHLFFDQVSNVERATAEGLWRVVQAYLSEIATSQPKEASDLHYELAGLVDGWQKDPVLPQAIRAGAERLYSPEGDGFWDAAWGLVDARVIVARLPEHRKTCVLTCTYTERFEYKHDGFYWLGIPLRWLGWEPSRTWRETPNLGKANSLWILSSAPPGVEPVRSYWSDAVDEPIDPVQLIADSDRTIANRYEYRDQIDDEDPPGLVIEAQVAPSASVAIAFLLSGLLLSVTTYIYQAPQLFTSLNSGDANRVDFLTLAGVFAAVPAGVGAALAYNGQTFVRRLSRGLRSLLALLSILAAALAVLICLKRTTHAIDSVSYWLSVYSFFSLGAFGYTQWGPRWRKSRRSRLPFMTGPRTPAACRSHQHRCALGYLVLLGFSTVVFARCQHVLRLHHFFTHQFPGNIWHAWWSWF